MLTASGLRKAHGTRVLFDDVSLRLSGGRRVALVGGNGNGKTTLLEILTGEQPPDAGEVHHPKHFTIGYLPQDLTDSATGTVLEETLAGAGDLAALADRLHRLEQRLSSGDIDDDLIETYGEVQSRFEQLGGYAIEAEAHRVLDGLGFATEDRDRPVPELSGGWRMRVALARLLLSNPDLLILDEPTNHLDVDSVAWLESHLVGWPGALFFVSHDRDFIDNVADRVIELAGGTATEYVGGFAEFVVQREERLAMAEAAAANQQKRIAETERFIERFRYKATKARQVQSRIKTLEKLERIEVPDRKELTARFAFPEPQRSSRVVAELEDATVGYGDTPVLSDVSMVVERGDKIGLIGPNGAGKSTLIKAICGELTPLDGSITIGNNVDIAVFAQHQTELLVGTRTVFEEFNQAVGAQTGNRNLRTVLGSFGFPGDAADRRVSELSGGERTRLALAKIMVLPVNLLILDEPTNHLDLPSCDVLEDALGAYPGTVLLVTHDRHLIRAVADALVVVRDGVATHHDGVDEDLLRPVGDTAKASPTPTAKPQKQKQQKQPKRVVSSDPTGGTGGGRTRELRKKVGAIERRWEKAEAEVGRIQERLGDPAVYADPDEVASLVAELDTAKDRAATLMDEWEQASRRLERSG